MAISKTDKKGKLPKAAHIPTLLALMSLGAAEKAVPLTTVELAEKLGKSQQLVSKHLEDLEKEGVVQRYRRGRKMYVRLTEMGSSSLSNLYLSLHKAFAGASQSMLVDGKIFSGLREAAYYVSQEGYRKQFVSKVGFEPYPGTLNLRVEPALAAQIRVELSSARGAIRIEGFTDRQRTFGGATCFRALIQNRISGAVILIDRTIYDKGVLELIAPVNLRRSLRLKDGQTIKVRIFLQNSTP
jgi:riboflavin kinase, archaea type